MNALPNTDPFEVVAPKKKRSPSSKPAAGMKPIPLAAKRTREEIAGEFRGVSDYDKWSGWAAIPRVLASDAFSLASGAAWWAIVMYLVEQMGRSRDKNAPPAEEVEIYKLELSLLLRTSVHNINLVLRLLVDRQLAVVDHLAGEKAVVRLVFTPQEIGRKYYPGWSEVARVPHEEWARQQAEALRDEADEVEETADDAADQRGEKTHVKLKPATVKRGAKSRQKVEGFVKELVVECSQDSPVDMGVQGELSSGRLVLTICGTANESSRRKQDANRADATTYEKMSGRTSPESAKIPLNGGSPKPSHAGINRADELGAIFDPLLWESCQKTLTADLVSLAAASQAIGDTPGDFLRSQMEERGRRSIKSPKHCAAICAEIGAHWKRGGSLKGVINRLPTRDEIDAIIEQERIELLNKKAELRKGKRA